MADSLLLTRSLLLLGTVALAGASVAIDRWGDWRCNLGRQQVGPSHGG